MTRKRNCGYVRRKVSYFLNLYIQNKNKLKNKKPAEKVVLNCRFEVTEITFLGCVVFLATNQRVIYIYI